MNRRDILKALPAVGAAAAMPTLTGAGIDAPKFGVVDFDESPLRALYRQWQAVKDDLNAYAPDRSEDAQDALYGLMMDLQQQATDFTPRTMEDLAFKIVFADDDGDMDRSIHHEALAVQAHAMLRLRQKVA